MAIRETPQSYWQTRAAVQTQEPVTVQQAYVPPTVLQFPEINTNGMIILGVVAVVGVVGLLGLIALLNSNKKCSC